MAKCSKCGKSGLFLKIDKNGLCKDCAAMKTSSASMDLNKLRTEIAAQTAKADKQLERLNAARNKYEPAGDYESLIKVYESVFKEKNDWNTCTHKLRLAEYYLKAGYNDKSWLLLTRMVTEFPDDLTRIRRQQYKQLKSEKKYDEALKMWYLFKFNNFKYTVTRNNMKIDDFTVEAVKLGTKASLSGEEIDKLSNILVSCVEKQVDETEAISQFNKWYSCINKM